MECGPGTGSEAAGGGAGGCTAASCRSRYPGSPASSSSRAHVGAGGRSGHPDGRIGICGADVRGTGSGILTNPTGRPICCRCGRDPLPGSAGCCNLQHNGFIII